jgi:AcrR family transcriptional regulator
MEDFTNKKKYKSILDTSKELFWKYGFRRVTIEEICREAKISKMTFYRYFPNKVEVAKAVFDMAANEGLTNFRKIIQEETSPSEKMKKMLQMKLDGTNNISSEFLNDFYNNPELGLTPYIEEKTRIMWTETLDLFRVGQKKGMIREDMKVEFMFLFLQKTAQLITDDEMLKLCGSPQNLIMELTNMFLYGISPQQ